MSWDEEDDTEPCPHCGKEIYDGSERCPACGQYLSREDAPPTTTRPWWFVVLAVVCLLVALGWALRRW
jgi:hypothetical protein